MTNQLHEGLAIAQDFRFESIRQDRIRHDEGENGGNPAGQKNWKNYVEPLKAIVPRLQFGWKMHSGVSETGPGIIRSLPQVSKSRA